MAKTSGDRPVNNAVYRSLADRWYEAHDDPVALLRAESKARSPFILDAIARHRGGAAARVLDVGCGAGFFANAAAARGHAVVGVDASDEALDVARRHDATRTVGYAPGDALRLAFADGSFDVVVALDLLEHVERPHDVVAEASRVLAPGGLFFFHTFNRNFVSWLVVIKGVEWFVKNTPHDLHVLRLFVKPEELRAMCAAAGLSVREIFGFGPRVLSRAFFRMLVTGVVPEDFEFRFSASPHTGYTGWAVKESAGRLDAKIDAEARDLTRGSAA